MQSGIAPCPGKTTRSAASTASAVPEITTRAFGATTAISIATAIPSEGFLGRRDPAGGPRIGLDGHAQRTREGLEDRLALVVRVVAAQVVDVQCDLGVVHEALEELARQVDVEVPDHRPRERNVPVQARTARKVDHDARERLVERHVGVAIAADALLVADRARNGLAERDADVLDRVVRVDVQVALRLDLEVDETV